jgi:hypothetical protein
LVVAGHSAVDATAIVVAYAAAARGKVCWTVLVATAAAAAKERAGFATVRSAVVETAVLAAVVLEAVRSAVGKHAGLNDCGVVAVAPGSFDSKSTAVATALR